MLATATVIINGNAGTRYPSAPSLVQDSQYPTSNLKLADIYTPWATPHGTAPDSMKLHIDIGSNLTVGYVAFLGMRWLGTSENPVDCTINYRLGNDTLPTYGYSATGFSYVAYFPFNAVRHKGVTFSPIAARYWEFDFTSMDADGWSIGGIYLGTITSDLGFLYTPQMDETLVHPTVRGRTGAGHPSAVTVGDDRRMVVMPFDGVDDTAKSKIDSVFGTASYCNPALWIDRVDNVRPVMLASDQLTWTHNWNNPNLWSTELELETLG